MKNVFAVVGFIVIAKKALELYREYSTLKRAKEQWSASAQAKN
jgi:hypothetical protein